MSYIDNNLETLDPKQLIDPKGEYQAALMRAKQKYPDRIALYDSEEVRAAKKWLRKIVGDVMAWEIMNNYL